MDLSAAAGCPECARLLAGRGLVRRGPFAVHGRAEPGAVPGWLIVASMRHVEQLEQLDLEEAQALGPLLAETTAALRRATGGERVYLALFCEALPHFHVNVVARPAGWPGEPRGAALLASPARVEAAEAARVTQQALGLLAARSAGPTAPPGRRRKHRALLLSALVCPGAGQLANGQWRKGLLLVGSTLALTAWLALRLATLLLARLPADEALADPFALLQAWNAVQAESFRPLAAVTALLALLWAYSAWDAHHYERG